MEITKDYILLRRNINKTETDCIVYFVNSVRKLKTISTKIKNWNCRICHVFENCKYHKKATYALTILNNPILFQKIDFEDCLPFNEITKNPQACPVTFDSSSEWKDIDNLIVLPNNGWDFYELEWILKRWESSLGIFDFDNFWIASTYPMDIYNNPVHFSIVLFYIKLFIKKKGLNTMKMKFHALYQFHNKLGNMLLEFFYHETIHPTTDKAKLYEKIHQLYHKTSASHPYRRYLFYKNYSLTSKQKFRLNLYIQQYLSFTSMYICSDFCFHRKQQIISGIEKGNMEFFQFFEKKESKLEEEIGLVNKHHSGFFQWIGKDHIKKIKSPFWKFVYHNWANIPRNINLWDVRVVYYNDHQMKIGEELCSSFPIDWVRNFHNKDFIPKIRKKRLSLR